MDVLEVLRAARDHISDPSRWVQHSFGDGDGRTCAAGACIRQDDTETLAVAFGAWDALDRVASTTTRHSNVQDVNDKMGHAAVLALFDRAIEVEEAKAAEFDTGASHALLAIAERETVAA